MLSLRLLTAVRLMMFVGCTSLMAQCAWSQNNDGAKPPQQPEGMAEKMASDVANGGTPQVMGFNASMATSSQHDSSGGWSSVLTPEIMYRFNSHFSGNLGTPVYLYIPVDEAVKVRDASNNLVDKTELIAEHLLLGDTTLVGAMEFDWTHVNATLSATLGMPTGDNAEGLGAGQFTYAAIEHVEHQYKMLTPSLELGIDDSPNLSQKRVHKSYTVVGTSAHFLAGLSVSLPRGMSFQTNAYEEMPLGD